MLRTIKVYGALAKRLGQRVFKAEVSSVAEAVRFFTVNFPFIEDHIKQYNYRVTAGSFCVTDAVSLHAKLFNPDDIITFTPVVSGAGGAIGRVIAGIALIAASIFIPGSAALFGLAIQPIVFGIGASLALGGAAQLLAPPTSTADINQDQNPKNNSYSFSGVQNTTRQGVAVPIIYGEAVTGSVVISLGYDTTDTSDTVEGTEEEQ